MKAMLSHDELSDGTIFILKLWDAGGAASHWVDTLRDDTARRWYDIYRTCDWQALRTEAGGVFRHPATPPPKVEVDHVRKTHKRLVFIHTLEVKTDEVGALGSDAATAGDTTAGETEGRP
jgi:hypothetical protein